MKHRKVKFLNGPYRGKCCRVYTNREGKWEETIPTPYGLYRVEFNDAKNPVALTWAGKCELVVAEKFGPVVEALEGTTWIEGEDVSGGWVCATETTGAGRMEVK